MKNLVIYSAVWCSPCQQLKKTLQSTDIGIRFDIIDIDEHPASALEYAIRSVPAILLMEDNQVLKRTTGAKTAQQLQEFVA